MSKNIVFEGWLTKSPPSKRIWRTKWRRRWFALRQSGELPGQYFLDYYADRNCRRLKGTINLDLCEQVDAGLHMERTGNGTLDPKLRGSVFTIQTQSRTYHLEADCEADMEKWVDAICRVCGLRATDESSEEMGTCPNSLNPISTLTSADSTGPYIPISECITGVRAQDRAFSFNTKSIVNSTTRMMEKLSDQIHSSLPNRLASADLSENESNLSDEDCKSLNSSQSNIRDLHVSKSFTKLTISRERNGFADDGPPVPPRPPKTFAMSREMVLKEIFPSGLRVQDQSGPRLQETLDAQDAPLVRRAHLRTSQGAGPPSPVRALITNTLNLVDDDDAPSHQSLQYWNLSSMPPVVDRALKPRASVYNTSGTSSTTSTVQAMVHFVPHDEIRPDELQYLDLDLSTPQREAEKISKPIDIRKKVEISHGKSFSAADADSAYKTVDFLKTEAFNITRQDAEASRSNY